MDNRWRVQVPRIPDRAIGILPHSDGPSSTTAFGVAPAGTRKRRRTALGRPWYLPGVSKTGAPRRPVSRACDSRWAPPVGGSPRGAALDSTTYITRWFVSASTAVLTPRVIALRLSVDRDPDPDPGVEMLGGAGPMPRPGPAAAPDTDYATLRATLLDLTRDSHRVVTQARASTGPPGGDRPEIAELLGRIARFECQVSELRLDDLKRWAQNLRQQVEAINSAER
jgi:hypothetical protein